MTSLRAGFGRKVLKVWKFGKIELVSKLQIKICQNTYHKEFYETDRSDFQNFDFLNLNAQPYVFRKRVTKSKTLRNFKNVQYDRDLDVN